MAMKSYLENSQESYLLDYSYKDGILNLIIETEDIETMVIKLPSELLYLNIPIDKDRALRTFNIETILLQEVLAVENGRFVPSKDFGNYMSEIRKNYNLAYGLKTDDASHIFTLKGSTILCSVILSSLDLVEIVYID
jgi:hypothetical protein